MAEANGTLPSAARQWTNPVGGAPGAEGRDFSYTAPPTLLSGVTNFSFTTSGWCCAGDALTRHTTREADGGQMRGGGDRDRYTQDA